MNRIVATAIVAALCSLSTAALANDGIRILSGTFENGVVGLLVLSIVALIIQLVILRFRGSLLRQALKERDEAMDAMRLSKRKYQGLFEMAPVAIFRSSLDGSRYLAVNQAGANMYGYESVQDFVDNVSPVDIYADSESRQRMVEELKATGFIHNMEIRLIRVDGSFRDVLMTARLYSDEEFIEGCVVDVTDYRVIQKNLADKGRFLQALLDAMANPLFYKTTDGKYQLVNESFLRMLDTTSEAILGKTVYDVSPPDKAAIYHEMDEALFQAQGQAQQRYESVVVGASGHRDVVFSKQTVLDDHGRVEGLMGVITDITRIKRQERQIDAQRAQLKTLFESASELIFFKDTDGVYLGCNEKYAGSTGLHPDDVIGKTDFEIYPKGFAEQIVAKDKIVLETLAPLSYETKSFFSKDPILVEMVKAPMISAKGEVLGVLGVGRDITERKKLELALQSAEERYRTIFENATEGIFTATPHGRYLNANAAMGRLFGFDSAEALMREVNDIGMELYENPQDRIVLMDRVRTEKSVAGFQASCLRRDGSKFWIELHVRGVFSGDNTLHFIEGVATDASERKASEHELRRKAATDSLTGLPNREQLRQTCRHMLAQAKRSGEQVGILFIDLDGFKEINDTYGHLAGDDLLVQVSDRLRWRLRQSDVAARLGGDEFAVLLWNVRGIKTVSTLGQTFVETLTGDYQCAGQACRISASIGASVYPDHGTSVDDLLEKADQAMYSVKKAGKNSFRLADSSMETDLSGEEHLSKEAD
ncbi:sensor domain-containing diguanylate cyclase [Desulfovibrio ferrophilus]|uniref:Diguanylate cyclase with PAS/PAC sensor n=1 Tax=Desulfovibrio ferrophilus TaxID=241368 RepID=A0A2Z6AWW1_9BACT|nr:sensor domain-containing diguanylate cyclase [Desulfovibrio ferrophilus]BBD07739.1 diguanylate cyclase with PAS/PAC sensor [Desulfovibrio ferrophilus]